MLLFSNFMKLLLGVVRRGIFHFHSTFANMRSSINCPMAVWKEPCEAWLAENDALRHFNAPLARSCSQAPDFWRKGANQNGPLRIGALATPAPHAPSLLTDATDLGRERRRGSFSSAWGVPV